MASFGVLCVAVSVFFCLCLANETIVRPCRGVSPEKTFYVSIKGCQKPPCILKKGSNATIEIKFQPTEEIATLKTRVYALIFGIPLPFIGVDGKDACENILVDGNHTKVGCPLKPDVVYMYENTFPVLSYYPNVNAVVHWSLLNEQRNIVCFVVAVEITN